MAGYFLLEQNASAFIQSQNAPSNKLLEPEGVPW